MSIFNKDFIPCLKIKLIFSNLGENDDLINIFFNIVMLWFPFIISRISILAQSCPSSRFDDQSNSGFVGSGLLSQPNLICIPAMKEEFQFESRFFLLLFYRVFVMLFFSEVFTSASFILLHQRDFSIKRFFPVERMLMVPPSCKSQGQLIVFQ